MKFFTLLRGAKRRGNLSSLPRSDKDCRAMLIAMDGMYAKNARAIFGRNDGIF